MHMVWSGLDGYNGRGYNVLALVVMAQQSDAFCIPQTLLWYGTHTSYPDLQTHHRHEHTQDTNTDVDATANCVTNCSSYVTASHVAANTLAEDRS